MARRKRSKPPKFKWACVVETYHFAPLPPSPTMRDIIENVYGATHSVKFYPRGK